MSRLALFCARRPVLVTLLWLMATVALVAGAAVAAGPADDELALPGSESAQAAELLGDRATGPPGTIVLGGPGPQLRQAADELRSRADALPGVTASPPRLAPDGTVAAIDVSYGEAAPVARLAEEPRRDGVTVELSGDDFADSAPGGLAEGLGLLAAAVILLVAFRSLIAMVLPLAVGVLGVICGVCLLLLLQNLVPVPDFAVFLTIMLGLGVGIDYALLVVTRFRSRLAELADGGSADSRPVDSVPAGSGLAGSVPVGRDAITAAVVTAMTTAGRSVLVAGITVIVTGAGILFLGASLGAGLALAAGCGVFAVMLAALTLLPASLAGIGSRIDRYGLPRRTGGTPLSYRWSRVVQRRPWTTGLAAMGVLLVLALPAMDLRLGWSDASNRPVGDTTRRAHELLKAGFGPGAESPLLLASARPLDGALAQARRTPGVARTVSLDERSALVVPATGPQDEATGDLIRTLRADLPAPVLVTGHTAAGVDFAEHAAERLPWMIGAVLLASFLLLVRTFRSLVVPMKAVAVNLLSIGAAYGVVVAVFQWDVFQQDVLGGGAGGPIDAWVPMMLFVLTFGLSMDYEIFLLSRIREEYARTGDNSAAVAAGVARTARVITAAAAIMICVFAAFGTFDDRALRTLGIGMAAAVFLDATLIRMVLVPATMELLGDRNWWFPRTSRLVRR
ncbi:MMPL family transporter [Actinomadura sp. 9N407]|uniref:MMPL family transporter n=1 Tax=Actinomadura sp. 9N407 TaxID=3375154 RepID=UPI0037ADB886